MKDEIKEKMTIDKAKKILRGFLVKDCYYDTPLYYAIPYLLDYITNLQERNENAINETELGIQVLVDTKESYPMISCDVVINRYLKPILKNLGEDKDEK